MKNNNFVFVVSCIFLIIGVLHALRFFYGWEAQIGSFMVPMWLSWAAVLVTFYLSWSGFRLAKRG